MERTSWPLAWAVVMTLFPASPALWTQLGKPGSTTNIERRKYLADDVAMCSDCHTPLNG